MVVVRHQTKVEAALDGVFKGRREQLIADELKAMGIPAVVTPNGIGVKTGTLEVFEEEGGRVFEWTAPDAENTDATVVDAEIKDEPVDQTVAAEGEDVSVEQQPAQHSKGKGKKGKVA